MIFWIFIILGVVAILAISKLTHLKHKMGVSLIVLLFLFIVLTFIKVAMVNSVDFKSATGFFTAFKFYFSWLGSVFGNLKVITGNIIRMEWFAAG